jgi:hypothetical protein
VKGGFESEKERVRCRKKQEYLPNIGPDGVDEGSSYEWPRLKNSPLTS